MIGDNENDTIAGQRAGCKQTILLNGDNEGIMAAVYKILNK